LLDGEDVFGPRVDVTTLRRRVGMVFQKPNPFPKSVFDNVAYGPRIHGRHGRSRLAEVVQKSLEKAALWDEVKDRLPQNALGLSGGQQQRLCIARAIAVDPEILLMDEPTSALDPQLTQEVLYVIRALAEEKRTMIVVTHEMSFAREVADRVIFMQDGVIVEEGAAKDLLGADRSERMRAFIGQ